MGDIEQEERLRELTIRAVNDALDARRTIDEPEHRKHHEFIDFLIKKYEKRRQRLDKLIDHLLGWAIIGAAVFFVSGLGKQFRSWLGII